MKIKAMISFILSFVVFFSGFCILVFSVFQKSSIGMIVGVTLIGVGSIGYAVLFIVGLRIYLNKKGQK